MPEHTSWLTFLLAMMKDNLQQNAYRLGNTAIGNLPPTWREFEPVTAALMVMLALVILAVAARGRWVKKADAVIPDETLTLPTFFEAFLGYFYDLARSMMDERRAKKYFPLIGTASLFVFSCNVLVIIPGAPVATSSLNVTLASALCVFILFNVYGWMENGWAYVAHLAGPNPWLSPLLFPIEVVSLCARPVTLAVRLMLNMTIDHLVLGVIMGLVCVLVPIPVMLLGCLVIVVQTMVFTTLTTIYIAMATEDMAHHDEHH